MAAPELRPLGEALGTEAIGVDLSKLDDPTFAWIQQAFAEHPVLVFAASNCAQVILPLSAVGSALRASTRSSATGTSSIPKCRGCAMSTRTGKSTGTA